MRSTITTPPAICLLAQLSMVRRSVTLVPFGVEASVEWWCVREYLSVLHLLAPHPPARNCDRCD